MRILLWIIRIYRFWLIAWVILTWIPGVAGSDFHMLLGLPIIPVLSLFHFLDFGPIGLSPLIPLLLLNFAERAIARNLAPPVTAGVPPAAGPPPEYIDTPGSIAAEPVAANPVLDEPVTAPQDVGV